MPKISALDTITNPDDVDQMPIHDVSAVTTKKITLAGLIAWLQSKVGWITKSNIDWNAGGIWYEELGRSTLASASSSISVNNMTARKYLKIIFIQVAPSGATSISLRFNNDSGANYASRYSTDGTADGATSSADRAVFVGNTGAALGKHYIDLLNRAGYEKFATGRSIRANNGAGSVPSRDEYVLKWASTAQATRIDVITSGATFAAGTELIILGHD